MNSLQKFYFPNNNVCNIENMYFRGELVNIVNKEQEKFYQFNKGGKLSTNTYFNYFSGTKWLKYTCITEFEIKIILKGNFSIKLINSYLVDGNVQYDIVKKINSFSDIKREMLISYNFELNPFESMYFIEIESLSDNGYFYGGGYYTREDPLNNIHLGLVMCTYKREKFIDRNIGMIQSLRENILNHMDFFIVDNAHTISRKICKDNIHLIRNKNTGGAGGFTRGIIEILENYKDITHIVLMDDDILLDSSIIERTLKYLQYVRKGELDLFIGGATLRLDKKNIQIESGAVWNNNVLYNLKSGLNLKKEKSLLINNLEESHSYNAWVFLVIPVKNISLDNLPLPLFVRGDDMEYGKRLTRKLLTMNGLGVWHVPVHNKYSPFMIYYVLRNLLILNALYDNNFKKYAAVKLLLKWVVREILYYRYDNASLILKAYKDFLKGIDFLLSTDGENLQKNIMASTEKLMNYVELEKNNFPFILNKLVNPKIYKEIKLKKFFRLLILNGYLLPNFFFKSNYNIVEFTSARPIDFYKFNNVLQVDLTSQKGLVTRINRKKSIYLGIKLIKTIIIILFKYDKKKYEYRNRMSELTNIKFWKHYLNIN